LILLLRNPLSLSRETVTGLHDWHLYVGAVYFFGPALVFLIGDWRAGLRWTGSAFRWTPSEVIWLMGPMRKVIYRRRPEPEVGRFNAGQRLNMLGQLVGKWALGITGYLMHIETGQLLMYTIHVSLFAALMFLVGGHVYMGLINPSTRHSRHAIWGGFVHLEWIDHHHPGWVKKLPRAGESLPSGPPHKETASPAPKSEGKKK